MQTRAPAACPPEMQWGCALSGSTSPGLSLNSSATANNSYSLYASLSNPGSGSAAVWGRVLGTGSRGYGVYGSHQGSGYGVYGYSNNGVGFFGYSNTNTGMQGETNSTGNRPGVQGLHRAATGTGAGVQGQTNSTDASAGVYGLAAAATPTAHSSGVRGANSSTNNLGYGVWGSHAGTGIGVYGSSSKGRGVYGLSDNVAGVQGRSTSGDGVAGQSTFGYGLYANSFSSYGLYALSSSGPAAIYAVSGSPGNRAIFGTASTPAGDSTTVNTTQGAVEGNNGGGGPAVLGRGQDGVWGVGTANGVVGYGGEGGAGVYGRANGMDSSTETVADGVLGASDVGNGVRGGSDSGTGVRGESNSGYGVHGSGLERGVFGHAASTNGSGVYGRGQTGVYGMANSGGNGVRGEAPGSSGWGVYGTASEGTGVRAHGGTYGIYASTGTDDTDYAGYFNGNVNVTGNISKGSSTFRIDHPLDPANMYLSHSVVESPDMMNVYNGNAVLDSNGEAVVELPAYFGALNRDFRYQLTPIGATTSVLYIAEEIQNNRFKIGGGTPGLKVSWQVTGIRQDPFANDHRIQAEQMKPEAERGTYLYPAGYGQPESRSVQAAHDNRPQPETGTRAPSPAFELPPMPSIEQPQPPAADDRQR